MFCQNYFVPISLVHDALLFVVAQCCANDDEGLRDSALVERSGLSHGVPCIDVGTCRLLTTEYRQHRQRTVAVWLFSLGSNCSPAVAMCCDLQSADKSGTHQDFSQTCCGEQAQLVGARRAA